MPAHDYSTHSVPARSPPTHTKPWTWCPKSHNLRWSSTLSRKRRVPPLGSVRCPPCYGNGNQVPSAPTSAPSANYSTVAPPPTRSPMPSHFASCTWRPTAGPPPPPKSLCPRSSCVSDCRSCPKSSPMPIGSPSVPSSNTRDAVPCPSLGQPCTTSSPLGGCACTGDGPGSISSLWRPSCTSGVCKTQPPCSGTGYVFRAGSRFTTTKSTASSSATPSANIWTPGTPMSSLASDLLSPGMHQSSPVAPGSYREPWLTYSGTRSCLKFDGMDGRSSVQPCSSSLEASCPRSSAGGAGTVSTNRGVIPERLPPAWKLPDRVQLPYPVATTKVPVWDMEWRLVRLPDLWPCDTFAKPCTGPVRAPQQLELACAVACQPSSTGRASSESRSSGESTDTDRSDVPSQCSESVTMAESELVATPAAASGAVDTGFAQDQRADESVATRSTAAALGSAGVGSAYGCAVFTTSTGTNWGL